MLSLHTWQWCAWCWRPARLLFLPRVQAGRLWSQDRLVLLQASGSARWDGIFTSRGAVSGAVG